MSEILSYREKIVSTKYNLKNLVFVAENTLYRERCTLNEYFEYIDNDIYDPEEKLTLEMSFFYVKGQDVNERMANYTIIIKDKSEELIAGFLVSKKICHLCPSENIIERCL